MAFHLTQEAEEDILRIFLEGAELFGVRQAEAYRTIAANAGTPPSISYHYLSDQRRS